MTKPRQQREAFFDELQNVLDKISEKHYVTIAGDLNVWIGDDQTFVSNSYGTMVRFHEPFRNYSIIDFSVRII